jgi:uncharacterized protein YecE (DUF72 family)
VAWGGGREAEAGGSQAAPGRPGDRRTLVGTCGYSYEEWRGVLYPEALPKEDFLRCYSLNFPFVELDFSWYQMPKAASLSRMAERTGSDFLFAVKAHRSLTHEYGPGMAERAAEFARALEPLAAAGRLAAVLVQLPYSFKRGPDERRHLGALCDALAAFPLAVEFRNDEWHDERVFAELDRRKAALVLVDRPDLPRLPPVSATVTGGWSYLRFHGRNADAWWSGDASGRYDYLYSEEELRAAVPLVRQVEKKAEILFVAFNNHSKGRAVINANMLKGLLEG